MCPHGPSPGCEPAVSGLAAAGFEKEAGTLLRGVVAVRPPSIAPLGAVRFSGLRVDEQPFAVGVSRLGMAMVEEAAPALQPGA